MIRCEIRADNTLHIEGYVNAVERDSRPVMVPSLGRCVEQVRAGVFGAALAANPDVELLENHDHSRKLGSTSDGVLVLSEDAIGLRASADISDADIIAKARTGQLKGWSFGFVATSSEVESRANGIPRRTVTGMKLSEVSLIDGKYTPCYAGTLVEVRAVDDSAEMVEFRADEEIEVVDNSPENESPAPDYSYYERAMQLLELRYNPYHDPSNGRFCSGGGGGGGGVLVVEKGQKGKGVYVVDVDHDDEYEKWKASKSDGGLSAADKAIREATGGVVLKDEYTVVDAVATKKNKKASTTYDKTVLNADVDSNGNVMLKYASGEYSGNYGDEVQNVKYKIKAGFVDNTPVNLDLTKASSISGNTYGIKDVAKSAGMTWNNETNSWVKKDHIINTSTKFTASELASKSDSEIDKIYKAGFYKTGVKKGYSLSQLDDKAKTLKKKSREEQIATIEKFNSLK